ncbi:hypothetical protein SARC_05317 [Sphaeroforma arctica JP610]|uniref:Uncharacterized protein n=1 Tax=Sphaeroforma arctica JP610 TaxID=667725 RepID=A0A0L0FZZ4_9EUKA|nr:hypothetical protein SARC_05317 [Sphaeroforma arctica JP610]KNC82390.1 hypothetical protein SARC_05317 [Sphaeroforma arctica JP610]|eukprot:XP_014156292.1 hypothetical protein SARC_05317 [Sphaeroforma arctica JP610]
MSRPTCPTKCRRDMYGMSFAQMSASFTNPAHLRPISHTLSSSLTIITNMSYLGMAYDFTEDEILEAICAIPPTRITSDCERVLDGPIPRPLPLP